MSVTLLGAVERRKGMDFSGLLPYFSSLRAHAPEVEVVVFNHAPNDPALSVILAKFGAVVVDGPAFDAAHGLSAQRIEDRRFLEYGAWLAENPRHSVIVSDLFDVAWQRHPDTLDLRDGLLVAEENQIVGQCPYNRTWAQTFWPDHPDLLDRPVVCCGAFGGNFPEMTAYLTHFREALPSQAFGEYRRGWDTACLMEWVARGGRPISCLLWVNNQIAHLGYAPREAVQVAEGRVFVNGVMPTLIHQYFRHEAVRQAAWSW